MLRLILIDLNKPGEVPKIETNLGVPEQKKKAAPKLKSRVGKGKRRTKRSLGAKRMA